MGLGLGVGPGLGLGTYWKKSKGSNCVIVHLLVVFMATRVGSRDLYEEEINSQSLEDTQVGYISQKYTLDKYTLEKYT